MKKLIALSLLTVCSCASLLAAGSSAYPVISLSVPGMNQNPTPKDQFITLVIDGPTIAFDGNIIPATEVVSYVDTVLKAKNVSYVGVYVRQGTKYGGVVRGLDTLRGTVARNISLSSTELAPGRNL